MPRLHVVQMRFTQAEWDHLSAVANLRQITVEELLREQLRMSSRQVEPSARERSHLHVVARSDAERHR